MLPPITADAVNVTEDDADDDAPFVIMMAELMTPGAMFRFAPAPPICLMVNVPPVMVPLLAYVLEPSSALHVNDPVPSVIVPEFDMVIGETEFPFIITEPEQANEYAFSTAFKDMILLAPVMDNFKTLAVTDPPDNVYPPALVSVNAVVPVNTPAACEYPPAPMFMLSDNVMMAPAPVYPDVIVNELIVASMFHVHAVTTKLVK